MINYVQPELDSSRQSSIFHLTIDDDLMCKTHQKQCGKRKRETSKTKLQVPLLSHITCHYGTEQKPDLALALLKLPLHTIIKVETARAVKQSILLLLVPADVI